MNRRAFLHTTAALGAALPLGGAPVSAARIKLGFDSYSLRAFKWKAFELLDYAAAQKLDAIQLSSLDDYESLDPEYLARVRARAAQLGVTIDAGTGCICPLSKSWGKRAGSGEEAALKGLRAAKEVGATSLRCFMGSAEDRRNSDRPIEACMEETIRVFRAVKQQALDFGVKIALENHAGDMRAAEVLTIIRESGPEFVGACLDTGNPMWVMENPLTTMEILGPYTLTTHVRDSAVFEHPRGAAAQWCALGDGCVDLVQLAALHRKLCPHAAMHLEIITGRPPQILPYFEREFWGYFEKTPASEFVRFVELAKRGHPFMGVMTIEDATSAHKLPEFAAALREQQKVDLERSFEYARNILGAGARANAV